MMNMERIEIKTNCCQPQEERQQESNKQYNKHLPIAVIGSGPVGLATAAHLASYEQPFILLESGSQVGENILTWGHVQVFSPWKYNIDKTAFKLLKKQDWNVPNQDELPTGKEL